MDADEFAKAVRGGNEKFRADDLVLDMGSRKLTGKGHLLVKPTKLSVSMTLDPGLDPLEPGGPGVATKSDFWNLSGTLNQELKFHCHFGPSPAILYRTGLHILEDSVSPVEIETRGFGLLPIEERRKVWQQFFGALNESHTDTDFEAAEARRLADGSFEFRADFADHKLRFKNGQTTVQRQNPYLGEEGSSAAMDTLTGETATYTFALVQQEGDDLCLVMRSKAGQPPLTEAEHIQKFNSLLAAVSFVHGINAWPYRFRYWRGDEKIFEKFNAAEPSPRTAHTPFSGLRHEVNMSGLLSRAAEFLEPVTPFNEELTNMMYLFRQTGAKGVHRKVGALPLCALLESLTRLLYQQFGLATTSNAGGFSDFGVRKAELISYLDGLSSPNDSTRRLRDVLSSAQPTRPLKVEEKFEEVCHHMGLPWDQKMKAVKEAWERLRNPLAHGDFREGENITEQIFKDDTVAVSRIAGGFNTILLKLFGYTGIYNSSVFESGYDRM